MPYNGGKSKTLATKRHFTVVIGNKEHGLYVSSTPSSAARKAVTKLCASNKSKKVEFHIREITQGSKKKTYGPYIGYIEKLKEPIELKGRTVEYKPMAKLKGKKMSGGNYKTFQVENMIYVSPTDHLVSSKTSSKPYNHQNNYQFNVTIYIDSSKNNTQNKKISDSLSNSHFSRQLQLSNTDYKIDFQRILPKTMQDPEQLFKYKIFFKDKDKFNKFIDYLSTQQITFT
jgi:hypothetical protein